MPAADRERHSAPSPSGAPPVLLPAPLLDGLSVRSRGRRPLSGRDPRAVESVSRCLRLLGNRARTAALRLVAAVAYVTPETDRRPARTARQGVGGGR
ncbi:hypothetical protein OK074_5073 [Actinobacteria bacterium OK074]|nr:hypothetical protein OK074_5073 [Actinobacteria bacterium OK074]